MTDENNEEASTTDPGFVLSDKWYKRLKWFVQIVLPAFSTLYFTLGNQFGWSNIEAVLGVSAAVATFVGTTLGFSTRKYNASDIRFAGEIQVSETEEGVKTYNLVMNGDPEEIDGMNEVTFKVASQG